MPKRAVVTSLACLFILIGVWEVIATEGHKLIVFYSNDVHGETEPCG